MCKRERYVSAQFHLKHDDFFETVRDMNALPRSQWQELARFTPEEMQGKTIKKVPETPAQKGARVTWEPDHTPMDSLFPQQGVPQQGGNQVPAPHLPFDPSEEQGESDNEDPPPPHPGEPPRDTSTRSGRVSSPPELFMEQVYAVLDDTDAVEDYELQREAEDPIAFAAGKSDPDTLYYNQAMQADDAAEFKETMLKEANAHTERGHWEVWEKKDVPEDQDILPSVWAFKRKRRIDTRAIYKHKARLNIHGGKQTHGVNYWETYSPVVN